MQESAQLVSAVRALQEQTLYDPFRQSGLGYSSVTEYVPAFSTPEVDRQHLI